MKKKNVSLAKLSLNKKMVVVLNDTGASLMKGGLNSINACQLSRRNCEPSWDTGCISHLSGCPLCPTWPTACEM